MLENGDQEKLISNNNNKDTNEQKRISLLNSEIIKREEIRKNSETQFLLSKEEEWKLTKNIVKLLIIIGIISFFFFFKHKLIKLKQNYLSDKSLFPLNIFYSQPKNNFLMFIILICCYTITSGFKLLILQFLTYLVSLLIIISKKENNFEINLVIFHCNDIIISFLFLGEKLMMICEENSIHIIIEIIILFFNYNLIVYFVLVEIINCNYDAIILDILLGLLSVVTLYYSIFYIIGNMICAKQIVPFLLRNLLTTLFICIIILIISFGTFLYFNQLAYFFVCKILMKLIGFLSYLIFELFYLFRNKKDKKLKYFNLYNLYYNSYLYSKTTKIKLFARVTIIVLLEYFLLYKLDISYKLNMKIYQCIFIILFDILHGFTVTFIIKYIFHLLLLNNNDLIDFDANNPLTRFGSVSSSDQNGFPPLIFE